MDNPDNVMDNPVEKISYCPLEMYLIFFIYDPFKKNKAKTKQNKRQN